MQKHRVFKLCQESLKNDKEIESDCNEVSEQKAKKMFKLKIFIRIENNKILI